MSHEEAGIVGALGALLRLTWIFGLFPMTLTPEVKVSKWKSFYSRYVLIPYVAVSFVLQWSKWVIGYSYSILEIISRCTVATISFVSLWTAPERARKWLECLRTMEKVIVRTKSVNTMDKVWTVITFGYLLVNTGLTSLRQWNSCMGTDACSPWEYLKNWLISFLSIVNVNIMMLLITLFAIRIHVATVALNKVIERLLKSETNDENEKKRQVLRNNYITTLAQYEVSEYLNSDKSQRIRDATLAYMSICQVIDTFLETVASIIMLLLLGNLKTLMTSTILIVDSCLSAGPFPIQRFVVEIIWCINVSIRTFFLGEPCQRIHETMLKTRELINQVRRKYSTDCKIVNELKLFYVITSLRRPTITPFDMYSLDRCLIAQLSGCTISCFVALMQLKVIKLI